MVDRYGERHDGPSDASGELRTVQPSTVTATTKRSLVQRALIAVNGLLVVVALATGGWGGYVYNRVSDVERVDLDDVLRGGEEARAPESTPGEPASEPEEPRPPSEPLNFLLVGSDSRDFVDSDEDADSFGGDQGPARADTILLARVDPVAKTAALVSFPRDLYLDIAGEKGTDRINTAFENGPGALIQTISENFGVDIDHYVQVDFEGFKELIDAVGGIEVWLSYPVRDWAACTPGTRPRNCSGLDISDTDCVLLDGSQALSYVRSRHFEQLIDGKWTPDLTSDLGRIKRQQDLVVRSVSKALEEGLANPVKLLRVLDAVEGHLFTDDNLGPGDAVDLAAQLGGLDVQTIRRDTVPTETYITPAGADVQRISDQAELDRIMRVFRGLPPEAADGSGAAPSAADVRLSVQNGTGRAGEALAGRRGFEAAGFTVVATGDRPPFDAAVTVVEHGAGQVAQAQLVARHLAPGTPVVEVAAAGVTVVTGADFTGVAPEPRADPAATSPTTVPPTTTTTLSDEDRLGLFYAGVGSAECYSR